MSVLDQVRLPAGWDTHALGRITTRSMASGTPDAPALSVFLGAGVVRRSDRTDNRNQLGADLSKYLTVNPGDIVVNKLRAWQGGIGVSAHFGIVSPAYYVLRPDSRLWPGFAHHLLLSSPYLAELTRLSKWMPPSQFDLPWDAAKAMPLLVPPIDEQQRIAAFLDEEVARIDQAITLRERQIELASEQLSCWLDTTLQQAVDKDGVVPMRRLVLGIEQGGSPVADNCPSGRRVWGVEDVINQIWAIS